ncbi:MAG: hypothetical protein NTW95_12915 [Candidatus Aminicenantes bacterium]|nr:hypothetical protein [Candidatus Aminicenantes bacterium]
MKKNLEKLFPLALALFSFAFYLALFRPPLHSLGMSAAGLTFFTALAWSALIFLSRERRHWLRFFYALLAVLLSIALVELIRFSPAERNAQRLLYGFNLLGIAIIETYFHIIRPERKQRHD